MELISLQVGNLLSSSHELIEKILKHLSFDELVTATQVCQNWASVGCRILERERKLKFTTIHPFKMATTDPENTLKCFTPPAEALEKFFENLPNKPVFCIAFTCGGWLFRNDIVTKYFPNGSSFSNLLKTALPNTCGVALMEARGVIGSVESPSHNDSTSAEENDSYSENETSGDSLSCLDMDNSDIIHDSCNVPKFWSSHKPLNNVGYSIEIEAVDWENEDALSLLLVPKHPGVQFKVFNLSEKTFYKKYRPDSAEREKNITFSDEEFNSICGLKPEDKLKSFLVFSNSLKSFTRSFLGAAQARENDNIAIGGGLVNWLQQKKETFRGIIGVAISGENVHASSIVVPSSVRDEMALMDRLKKLKEIGFPENHSVCFLFSCCGRGSFWYSSRERDLPKCCNVETKIFRMFFPHTPIFGFFGDGEIGNSYPVTEEDSDGSHADSSRKRKKQKLFHQYSSVFVLISFL